jgi:tRNA(fMet)-specific endonuclease VapC
MLDTNVCVRYLNERSVVKAELFYGANRSNNPQLTLANQRQFLNLFVIPAF